MSNGLDLEKILLIALIAAILLGPERLPGYAASLGRFARRLREWLDGARTRVKEEMGPDFDEIEWRKLDPRQYDPRRIIREALIEEPSVRPVTAATATEAATAVVAEATDAAPRSRAGATPYDTEAT